MAVAKVEALTRQLEELRRDRRGPLNLIPGNGGTVTNGTGIGGNGGAGNGTGTNGTGSNGQQIATSPAALELDKLRRELMVSFFFYFFPIFIYFVSKIYFFVCHYIVYIIYPFYIVRMCVK